MEIGDKVRYLGCTDAQISWGSNSDPRKVLKIGKKYIISDIDVHSWHTKISLEGIVGKYNSACFE